MRIMLSPTHGHTLNTPGGWITLGILITLATILLGGLWWASWTGVFRDDDEA